MNEETPDNFLSYLAGTNEAEYHNLYTFAVDALTFSNKINIYHWSCESGFHHEHLQNVYELIRKFADDLVELVLATGTEFKINSKTYLISDEIYSKETMLRKLRSFIDELINFAKQFQSKITINNLMSDYSQKLETEYGLLSNFN